MDWKDFLPGRRPRTDLDEPFAADSIDIDRPALLNNQPVVTAAAVAARLLEIVALRGGTRIKPSAAEKLRAVLWRALPSSAAHLCDDEASRILRWLADSQSAATSSPPASKTSKADKTPQVDMIFEANLESRISVAQLAIDEGYDLELEYFDPYENIWPRIRCTPVELKNLDPEEPAEDPEPTLGVDSDFGELDIPIHHVRWLMPISSHRHRRAESKDKPAGKLLNFPDREE
jgi:hypothetical protein